MAGRAAWFRPVPSVLAGMELPHESQSDTSALELAKRRSKPIVAFTSVDDTSDPNQVLVDRENDPEISDPEPEQVFAIASPLEANDISNLPFRISL